MFCVPQLAETPVTVARLDGKLRLPPGSTVTVPSGLYYLGNHNPHAISDFVMIAVGINNK
jgi:hypothetical protein